MRGKVFTSTPLLGSSRHHHLWIIHLKKIYMFNSFLYELCLILLLCIDFQVVTSDVDRILTKGAYMLFYAR